MTSYALGDDAASWRALNVARALLEAGYLVVVRQYVRVAPQRENEGPVGHLRGVVCEMVVSSRVSCFFRHLRFVARERPDVVIGNNINGALFSLFGRLRTPLVLDMHGDMVAELTIERQSGLDVPIHSYALRKLLYQLTELVTRKVADRISCVSRTMMRVLRERGVQQEKLLYLPNCVDLNFFRPRPRDEVDALRLQLGIGRNRFLIGYLGRFQPWQGFDSFLATARCMSDEGLSFLIVGGDETRTEGRLHIVRSVPVEKMPSMYAVCDLLVLPRPSHPATELAAPTKFAEYAAMGKPILTTDVGDASDLVRLYGCGVVVEDNSPAELKRGIRDVYSRSQDELTKMGQAARRLAEAEFNVDIIRRSLSDCIASLIGG